MHVNTQENIERAAVCCVQQMVVVVVVAMAAPLTLPMYILQIRFGSRQVIRKVCTDFEYRQGPMF